MEVQISVSWALTNTAATLRHHSTVQHVASRVVCLFTPQPSLIIIGLTTEGWPGWVDLAGFPDTQMVCSCADGQPY